MRKTSSDDTEYGLPSSDDVAFLDLEANGLRPTRIHCVAIKYRGEAYFCRDRVYVNSVLADISPAYIAIHNGIGYDLPALSSIWDISNDWQTLDTLVLSRLASPSRSGGHSLRAWGNTLGFPKGDYDGPWDEYSEAMGEYCIQDVEVLEQVYKALEVELKGFTRESIDLEHDVARIIAQQEKNGWLFDERKANLLLAKLKERQYELEENVHARFVPLPVFQKEVAPKYKADGSLSIVGLKHLGDRWVDVGGPYSRIEYPQFNLGSRQQIGRYLQFFGWKPHTFTETGQPIVDEKVLSKVTDVPEAAMIAEYLLIQKRIGMVESWLEALDPEDGRIHGRVRSNGAITGRMTHDSPNVAQVPSTKAPYGEECRVCWTVPEGFSLVGIDASGLELRMLAHYMDDENYVNELLSGDIHTANQRAAGLPSRDQAKTFIYAFLYGAGDAKIGAIVGGTQRDGRELKARFLRNTPSLDRLRDRVERASSRGYVRGLDGRLIHIRSQHAALNSLLQGAGAAVMKKGLVHLVSYADQWKLSYKLVGNIHDEWQTEVAEAHAEKFGHLGVACIQRAGIDFNLRCPLDGEYKIGKTWAETH